MNAYNNNIKINIIRMGCCESTNRKEMKYPKDKNYIDFSFKDVVPIKYYHYIKEYEFEKNLPSIKERTSNPFYKTLFSIRGVTCEKQSVREKICL
jgi:hypothetical protein